MRRLAAVLGLAFGLFPALAVAGGKTDARSLVVRPTGPVETVFDWSTQKCADSHVPDSSARAFRRDDGTIALIASHNDNRVFTGTSLDTVRPDCSIVFEAARDSDLAKYNDLAWISGVYTSDGKTVHALVHAELRGERTKGLCPAGKYSPCLFNTVTAVVSRDGGRTFEDEGKTPSVVAALPYPFPTDRKSRVGYANPSNIIERDGWFYMFVFADGYRAQKRGACLLRTKTLDDPSSWRAWDGHGFDVSFLDPFRVSIKDPESHVCEPVPGLSRMVGSIVQHRPSGKVIAVFGDKRKLADGRTVSGIFTSTSGDLIVWSEPTLVLEAPLLWEETCGADAPVFYPALLDPDAKTPSFEDMDDTAELYLARYQLKNCRVTWDRDLIRIPVRVEVAN